MKKVLTFSILVLVCSGSIVAQQTSSRTDSNRVGSCLKDGNMIELDSSEFSKLVKVAEAIRESDLYKRTGNVHLILGSDSRDSAMNLIAGYYGLPLDTSNVYRLLDSISKKSAKIPIKRYQSMICGLYFAVKEDMFGPRSEFPVRGENVKWYRSNRKMVDSIFSERRYRISKVALPLKISR